MSSVAAICRTCADVAGHAGAFQTIVLDGAYAPMGMGRFDDVLSPADADAIHAYVIDGGWRLKQ